ncbi:MAG: ABC transporter ATP-binding protein [Bacteroidota bacterium]
MKDNIAIQVENLGKRFKRRNYSKGQALRHNLEMTVHSPLKYLTSLCGSPSSRIETTTNSNAHFWALKEVSFTIRQGEVVGIVGNNGAGKSILLKILSRITKPTTGYAEIYGKCSSMLEVDTGFHKELTGAENIFMSGAILGMKKGYIKEKFEEIVNLAELADFLHMPVKRYSSGMRVRLAFAIAAQLRPHILILDEILSVGDHQFITKCLRFLKKLTDQETTVLLVSHNEKNILQLCTRAFLMDGGKLVMDDSPEVVINTYLRQKQSKIELEKATERTSLK